MNGWLTIKTRLLNGELKQGLKEIVKSLGSAKGETLAMVKSFGKLALALGLIVGVFKLIQGGMTKLLERNEELSAKIETIKNAVSNLVQGIFTAMANLLEPVITRIVDWIYKFMSYLNVITKEFFNLDLFAKNTSKSLKSGAKSAKEIKKSLAGFDEMNVLSDTSSSGGGGGGGTSDFKMPEVDTTQFEEKVKTLREDWREILDITVQDAKETFLGEKGVWGTFKLGLFWVEQGFVKVFDGILKIFSGDFKEGFKSILEGIGTYVMGSVTTAFGFIKGIFEKIQSIGKTIFSAIGASISSIISSAKDTFKNFFNAVKNVVKGIGKLFTGDLKGAISTFKDAFKNIMNGLWTIAKTPLNAIISGINALIKGINKISFDVPDWVPGIGGKKWGFNIPSIPKLAQGGIVNNPGAGVMMGSYIAGERGAEAVLPLTDDTLQRLANMIPITIDLTNTIDGRTLNRRLETIRMNDSFAGNR